MSDRGSIATSQDLSKYSAEMVRKLSPSPLGLVPDCPYRRRADR
jgi:hypothetical protein